jgi:hypothetical protein
LRGKTCENNGKIRSWGACFFTKGPLVSRLYLAAIIKAEKSEIFFQGERKKGKQKY